MAIKSRNELKTYFETGDKPTEEQFSHFIDSYYHKKDTFIKVVEIKDFMGGWKSYGDKYGTAYYVINVVSGLIVFHGLIRGGETKELFKISSDIIPNQILVFNVNANENRFTPLEVNPEGVVSINPNEFRPETVSLSGVSYYTKRSF